jgi:phenylpropionate dioxygenase-like ring-hydroxylating dioxygenase large terminal subunit
MIIDAPRATDPTVAAENTLRASSNSRFRGFANVWTPVMLSRSLKKGVPVAQTIAGERLVFFRDEQGAPRALFDVCPHRGVALSLGTVKAGCLVCPFHGWEFDGQGKVVHVPWNPDAKKQNLSAASVPTRELGRLIWVYTAAQTTPEAQISEPYVAEELLREDVVLTAQVIRWKTHWTRAMENMLDWPHLPFIHAKSIGRGMLGSRDSTMEVQWRDTDFGAESSIALDGKPREGRLDYLFPNGMRLFIPIPNRVYRMVIFCVPVDENTTDMVFLTVRDFLKFRFLDFFFNWLNRRIGNEDQAVLESSYPSKVPPPALEKSVRTDAFALSFRARFRKTLDAP